MVKFMLLIIGISTAKRFLLLMLLLMLEGKKGLEGVAMKFGTGCVFVADLAFLPCVNTTSRQHIAIAWFTGGGAAYLAAPTARRAAAQV